jgi:FeoB-associated Cys-rich membrane protein
MSPQLQTIVALAVVALAAIWLARRALVKKKTATGCGGDCGCNAQKVTARLKQR